MSLKIYSFLSFPRYNCSFIQNFFHIAILLTSLTRKDVKFIWDESCESTLMELKQRPTSALVFTVPTTKTLYIMHTYTSGIGLAIVLM